ncbi:type II-A CRISPR-associated protein Csn2, partial [Gemella sp. GH3]|uniref:type II-A CRISPR-associated protein Csn2 n=1 Tax=unclassified Gemella TaxID=2624949 RepID=UPI0015D02F4E
EKIINISEDKVNTIIIEDKIYYRNFVEELLNQSLGHSCNFIVSQDGKELNFENNVHIITDIFNLNPNNKKVSQKILSSLYKLSCEDYYEVDKLKANIVKYMIDLSYESDLDITFEDDIDTMALLKMVNFKINNEEQDLANKLIVYLKSMFTLADYKLIITLNLNNYFTNEELENIYEYVLLNKIKMININYNCNEVGIIKNEQLHIIDKDYCEI